MNSGSAASDHDALLPQIGRGQHRARRNAAAANCMPAQPVASSATPIQTPPREQHDDQNAEQDRDGDREASTSDPALHRALDHLLGGLRLRLFVARRLAAQHVDQFVDEGDEQDHEAAAIAELRNPQRHRDDALRHVVELPRLRRSSPSACQAKKPMKPAPIERARRSRHSGACVPSRRSISRPTRIISP